MKKKYWEIALHFLFWFFSLWMLNQNFVFESVNVQEIDGVYTEVRTRDYQLFYYLGISLLAKAVWVYVHAFVVFPNFLEKRNTNEYLLKLAGLLGLSIIIELGLVYGYLEIMPQDQKAISYFTSMWQLNSLFYLFYYGASVAYVLGKNWWINELIRKQLVQENLVNELNFLKSQINPHFLFNTLNNLFAIAEREESRELADGISDLSQMMRYMLYDCKADRVPLAREIEFLKSMMEMQQLRMEDDDDIVMSVNLKGDHTRQQIAPLILTPFVENAFKHGINWKEKSYIRIDFNIKANQLIFSVENSFFSKPENEHSTHSGIGLENVKRRLELIYGKDYELTIKQDLQRFLIQLTLNLDK